MNLIEEYQRLNGLILNFFFTGRSSSREAEATRDMMDAIWKQLTAKEQDFIRQTNEGRAS